ncbi:MAG: toxin-antitoxin system, antitoxin component, Xre family protein [Nitrospirales bacterium]
MVGRQASGTILEKLRHLPQERLAEAEDFVDFLAHRQTDERGLTRAAGQLATGAFMPVWDNPAEADYDRL